MNFALSFGRHPKSESKTSSEMNCFKPRNNENTTNISPNDYEE